MKPEEIRPLGLEELEKKLQEARHNLFNLRVRAASRQVEDTSAATKARREIALLLTVKQELVKGR